MKDVSIVFGTYNRLKLLKACVESVRQSIGKLRYEIIIVDGNSTDGTREWLIEQPDVIPVLDRELEGAVKAFNKGFRIAQGKYVINLNDDLLIVDDAIQTAYDYMENHTSCGQGAFQFRLNDSDFKVSTVFDKCYANFGITRRELGDRLGWWGTDYHTYGGDTELSVKVWREGFTVDELVGSKVIDLLEHDELRSRNYKNKDVKGYHKDTKRFWAKWGHIGLARVNRPKEPDRLKVLHVALNTSDDEQPALRQALEQIGDYEQLDWRKYRHRINDMLLTSAQRFSPHIVFMQIQTDGVLNPLVLKRFQEKTDAFIINWNGDVRPTPQYWMGHVGEVCDLTLITNKTQIADYERMGCQRVGYLQIGFNDKIFSPAKTVKTRDVVFLGTNYGGFPLSTMRTDLVNKVSARFNLDLYGGGWPTSRNGDLRDHNQEAAVYRSAKIALGISAFDYDCYTSDRLFRAMGSGCFYLTKWFPGIESMFENKQHLVWWHDVDECLELVDYYLKHDSEREKIAKAGCKEVHKNHTWDKRIEEMLCLVRSYSPILATGTTPILTSVS